MRRILLIALVLAGAGCGKPGSNIGYLLNEPFSMLDWGIYRINQKLDEHELSAIDAKKKIIYDMDKNRFEILVSARRFKFFKAVNDSTARSFCEDAIGEIKQILSIDHQTGKRMMPAFSMELFFWHPGSRNRGWPTNMGKSLEEITSVHVYMPMRPQGKRLSCSSDLLSTQVLFGN